MLFARDSLLALGVLAAACTGRIDAGSDRGPDHAADVDGGAPAETDFDRAMVEVARSYKAVDRINRKPYGSSLGTFEINLYVRGDASTYRAIHPESTGKDVALAVGTVIVREVLGADGQVAKLTLMAKGPSDYDPRIGDWWFGEASPTGEPLVVDGVARLGRLVDCHGCHLPRAADDYLFGVPASAQGR